jgi:hypothetical protein
MTSHPPVESAQPFPGRSGSSVRLIIHRFAFLMSVSALLVLTGCFTQESSDLPSGTLDGMTIQNDEQDLSVRVQDRSDTITLDTVAGTGGIEIPLPKTAASNKNLTMTLVAEIAPPVVGGDTLQASSVNLKGGFAYVSYNFQGEPYRGGVDIIQIKNEGKAELRSQVLFNDADVHALHFDGDLYLATGTANEGFGSPAVLERVGVNGGKLVLKARERVGLGSFAGTGVIVDGKQVFATSGSAGGLSILSQSTLASSSATKTLSHARWVDVDDTRVVVAQGMPGRIAVYTKSTMALAHTWTFTGANVPEAKTTVRVLGGKALIAAGTGGVHVMNLATGKIVGSIPVPVVAGVPADRSVSNAADADGDLIYVSNGEAGVYAVSASSDLSLSSGDNNVALTTLGRLRFANLESVNHVAFDGNTLVVAAGKGGVKVVSVKWQ